MSASMAACTRACEPSRARARCASRREPLVLVLLATSRDHAQLAPLQARVELARTPSRQAPALLPLGRRRLVIPLDFRRLPPSRRPSHPHPRLERRRRLAASSRKLCRPCAPGQRPPGRVGVALLRRSVPLPPSRSLSLFSADPPTPALQRSLSRALRCPARTRSSSSSRASPSPCTASARTSPTPARRARPAPPPPRPSSAKARSSRTTSCATSTPRASRSAASRATTRPGSPSSSTMTCSTSRATASRARTTSAQVRRLAAVTSPLSQLVD